MIKTFYKSFNRTSICRKITKNGIELREIREGDRSQ